MTTRNIHDYNGATLAYIGDAVIELLIREALTDSGISDTGRLSAAAQKLVCAKTQAPSRTCFSRSFPKKRRPHIGWDAITTPPASRKMRPRRNTAARQGWKPYSVICTLRETTGASGSFLTKHIKIF